MTSRTNALWASLPIPAFIIDADDKIADLNPAAENFMNNSAKAFLGARVWDRLLVDAPMEEAVQRVRTSLSPLFISDVDVGTGERAAVQCNLQIGPLQDVANEILILMEPREIAGRLGRALSTQTAAKSAIGMAEMLAHEIKNPLAGITGAAQLLGMNLTPEDVELTDLIVEECRRIVKLLDQVEQFGNLRPPLLKPVNLHDVLERARKSAMVGFGAHISFSEVYDPSLPNTHADADQLLQVFLNLLKNASEACKSGGTIKIRTFYELSLRLRRQDGSGAMVPLQVEIIDDGPGLPADIAGDIFEPFISGRENGTGLGLALVSKIISEHGGLIAVESAPGRTVFRISLPIAPQIKESV